MGRGSACAFTLIELLVAIVLFATLGSIAVPACRNFLAGSRSAAEINGFAADFQYARSAAMRRGADVTLCASDYGVQCSGGGDWSAGWIVFEDVDDDRRVDPGETVLRLHAALADGDRLIGNRNLERHISFNRFGMLAGVYNGTLVLHPEPERIALLRCLTVSGVGKLRAGAGSDCVPKP